MSFVKACQGPHDLTFEMLIFSEETVSDLSERVGSLFGTDPLDVEVEYEGNKLQRNLVLQDVVQASQSPLILSSRGITLRPQVTLLPKLRTTQGAIYLKVLASQGLSAHSEPSAVQSQRHGSEEDLWYDVDSGSESDVLGDAQSVATSVHSSVRSIRTSPVRGRSLRRRSRAQDYERSTSPLDITTYMALPRRSTMPERATSNEADVAGHADGEIISTGTSRRSTESALAVPPPTSIRHAREMSNNTAGLYSRRLPTIEANTALESSGVREEADVSATLEAADAPPAKRLRIHINEHVTIEIRQTSEEHFCERDGGIFLSPQLLRSLSTAGIHIREPRHRLLWEQALAEARRVYARAVAAGAVAFLKFAVICGLAHLMLATRQWPMCFRGEQWAPLALIPVALGVVVCRDIYGLNPEQLLVDRLPTVYKVGNLEELSAQVPTYSFDSGLSNDDILTRMKVSTGVWGNIKMFFAAMYPEAYQKWVAQYKVHEEACLAAIRLARSQYEESLAAAAEEAERKVQAESAEKENLGLGEMEKGEHSSATADEGARSLEAYLPGSRSADVHESDIRRFPEHLPNQQHDSSDAAE